MADSPGGAKDAASFAPPGLSCFRRVFQGLTTLANDGRPSGAEGLMVGFHSARSRALPSRRAHKFNTPCSRLLQLLDLQVAELDALVVALQAEVAFLARLPGVVL